MELKNILVLQNIKEYPNLYLINNEEYELIEKLANGLTSFEKYPINKLSAINIANLIIYKLKYDIEYDDVIEKAIDYLLEYLKYKKLI